MFVLIFFFRVFPQTSYSHSCLSGFEVISIVLRNSASGLMVFQNPVETFEFEIEILLLTQILTRMLLALKWNFIGINECKKMNWLIMIFWLTWSHFSVKELYIDSGYWKFISCCWREKGIKQHHPQKNEEDENRMSVEPPVCKYFQFLLYLRLPNRKTRDDFLRFYSFTK